MPSQTTARNLHAIRAAANKAAAYIAQQQMGNGALPWYLQHKLDPWDHTEALMALASHEYFAAWNKGFDWLAENQHEDGSWLAAYFVTDINENTEPADKVETNFVAYPATGLWHRYLCNQDKALLHRYFPVVKKAIDFVLRQQNPEGDIQWALLQNDISDQSKLPRDALVTACSSILRSLECAISIAESLNQDSENWKCGYHALYDALKNKPWRFDRTWESKARFSMDWFYPIIAGIYNEQEAQLRLRQRWHEFVEPNVGCRCVNDEPWMTVAESSELCLALIAANKKDKAMSILNSLISWQDDDGGFWTGYNFRDDNIWPREKTTWTAAAYVLASDALLELSPASSLFTQPSSLL